MIKPPFASANTLKTFFIVFETFKFILGAIKGVFIKKIFPLSIGDICNFPAHKPLGFNEIKASKSLYQTNNNKLEHRGRVCNGV